MALPPDGAAPSSGDGGRRRVPPRPRRLSTGPGRAHIEVHGVHRLAHEHVGKSLEEALHAVEGVHWAEVNPVLARVVVAFDGDLIDVDDLLGVIDEVEEAHSIEVGDLPEDRPEHPGDFALHRWRILEIAADVTGIAAGGFARALRLPRLPLEIAASLTALDSLPPIRRRLERDRRLEAMFVSTGAVLNGVAQGPFGLIADAAYRTALLRESVAHRSAWQRMEPRLHTAPRRERPRAFERDARPRPLPGGMVERYHRAIPFAAAGVGAAGLAVTRNPRAVAGVLLAAVPRAARWGREGFASHLGTMLAARDAVVMDARALRRLDRIDTVLIEDGLLSVTRDADLLTAAVRNAAQDLVVSTADDLLDTVRRLQSEERVVALISTQRGDALAASDCGIGVTIADELPPWGAHVLCPTVDTAAFLIDATAAARTADRRSVAIASTGAALGSALALTPYPGASQGAVLTSNATAVLALGIGALTAAQLRRDPSPPESDPGTPWYALPVDEVLIDLATSESGLDHASAAERYVEPEEASSDDFFALVRNELSNPLTVVLAAGGALSSVTGSLVDGLLIGSVLGINAVIGASQRIGAERAIQHLNESVSKRNVRVRRAGVEHFLPASELVSGDVVVLQAGDVVPADCRILQATNLEADESAITGESMPVHKRADPALLDVAVAERASMVYAGSSVAAGRADVVVVATGSATEAQRGVPAHARSPETGVEARLDGITRKTIPVVLAAGGVLTGSSLLRGAPARQAIANGVSLTAAAVPEGLPFVATVAQLGAARRLARKGVLVRNPRVLEALGRVDVLCFDKTGTLTEGVLRVASVSDGRTVLPLTGLTSEHRSVLAAALRATPRPRARRLPHPTDQAVVDAGAAIEVEPEDGLVGWHKEGTLPFEPRRGYHAVIGRSRDGRLLTAKGAPEVVLSRCATWRGEELNDKRRRALDRHVDRLARAGLRVLAVAERVASSRRDLDDDRIQSLDLRGFVTVADVARASAREPIVEMRNAGIDVLMLTGDHPATARAIASDLGIPAGGTLTGSDIDALSDQDLDSVVSDIVVFARVTPAHKVRIVQALQRRERVVAMTGDGANDAHAIRLANIGIAFGPRSTAAARAAADLVIVDDGVATVIDAILEGRAMWASVRDALALLLGGNLGEVIFTTGVALVTGRSPLNARQLLAVNLLTDLAPAMALAIQPQDVSGLNIRQEGPDTSLGAALARDVVVRAVATSAAATGAWTLASITGTPTRARTVALAAVVGSQLGQTFVAGHRSPLVLASSVASVGALVAIVQTPGISQFFGCRPLGPVGWGIAGTASAAATIGAAMTSFAIARLDRRTLDIARDNVISLRARDIANRLTGRDRLLAEPSR